MVNGKKAPIYTKRIPESSPIPIYILEWGCDQWLRTKLGSCGPVSEEERTASSVRTGNRRRTSAVTRSMTRRTFHAAQKAKVRSGDESPNKRTTKQATVLVATSVTQNN